MEKITLYSVGDRLKDVISALNMSEYSFAKALGYSNNSMIQRITKGIKGKKTLPSYETLMEIVTRFRVNPTWLMTGEGDMFRSEAQQITNQPREPEIKPPPDLKQAIEEATNSLREEFEKKLKEMDQKMRLRDLKVAENSISLKDIGKMELMKEEINPLKEQIKEALEEMKQLKRLVKKQPGH